VEGRGRHGEVRRGRKDDADGHDGADRVRNLRRRGRGPSLKAEFVT
jgi:hypothetical protein